MALKLKEGEEVLSSVNLHWTSFIWSGFFAAIGALLLLMSAVVLGFGKADGMTFDEMYPGMIVYSTFCIPFFYRILQNKCKVYAVTNKRLYIEEGILAKNKQDIPFNKINDIELKQSIVQRLTGSGNIIVLTGNSVPIVIQDIDNPDDFKDKLFEIAHGGAEKAA